jgi:zinc transporter ZupT
MSMPRRILIAFAAVAVLAVCAAVGAAATIHDNHSPTPQHTVRDFLIDAVAGHDGMDACAYMTSQAQREILAHEPHGMSCVTAVADSAHLELGGKTIDTEAAVKALGYRVRPEPGGRVRVTVSSGGDSRSVVLRKATQSELVEFSAPPTPWRVGAGAASLFR